MNILTTKLRKLRNKISGKLQKKNHVNAINSHMVFIRQIVLNNYIENLKGGACYQDDKCLIKYGQKIYSQNEEDGIIREIFNRIGTSNKMFVEFGIGDGLENNTLALLLSGWKGLWIDGSSSSVNKIIN